MQAKPAEAFEVKAAEQKLQYFLWVCRRPFTDLPLVTITFKFKGMCVNRTHSRVLCHG